MKNYARDVAGLLVGTRSSSNLLRSALVATALVVSATSAQAASFNISNSFAGWLGSVQALGPTTLGTGTFVGVGCAPGVACPGVAVNGLPGVSFTQVGSGSASYDGGLLNNLNGGYLEWIFTKPQNGWGGTFAMSATGNAGLSFQALDLPGGPSGNLGWIDVTTIAANQGLNGFFGFSSAEQFGGVRVSALQPVGTGPVALLPVGNGPVGTSYRMTDVSVATAVPEPASLTLLGLGLAGLRLARRRKA